jgi:Head fiber protein.
MGNQIPKTLVVLPSTTAAPSNQAPTPVVLKNTDGTAFAPFTTKAAYQANSTATDVAGLVADFNALLTKLKAAGLMAAS